MPELMAGQWRVTWHVVLTRAEGDDWPDRPCRYTSVGKWYRPHSLTLDYDQHGDLPVIVRCEIAGYRLRSDGKPGTLEHAECPFAGEWPEWVNELAERYQPDLVTPRDRSTTAGAHAASGYAALPGIAAAPLQAERLSHQWYLRDLGAIRDALGAIEDHDESLTMADHARKIATAMHNERMASAARAFDDAVRRALSEAHDMGYSS